MTKKFGQLLLLAAAVVLPGEAFQPAVTPRYAVSALRAEKQWTGEVVTDEDGRIKGCTVTPVSDTEFTIEIDGNSADLGSFSNVVYRKITSDAKRQQFQGFRPGTLPPNLIPAYRTFAMDEVAREAVLEALQQNDIRPFASAREEMLIEQVSIPPKPKKKKKKKGGRKKNAKAEPQVEVEDDTPVSWETFDTMKEALNAGWEPGQSFSFVAKNCKGQKLEPVEEPTSVI
mmetsp:Transcript_33654/g.60593  ORF Transcript_33654/g.60593 Transcript_33654/m.60593 type:complete len:229 (-) Transcript_33654:123-809(-)|eukprot:CAMPEP_0201925478 /NCGR_PEP_ID=MMETSP0903-20130614/14732_1 /ASSEMBLY_ACC=CAM_ASM_000552 /TAXON_ID=420261 /ORGANISM="Thalassiosira antarctica, Strain CCMP982" /LENGTH=228 /DNA_ID=CAMNT_0048463165 /DNA_START=63 /DNA_END=749 /DNA_ORIENTATION=+